MPWQNVPNTAVLSDPKERMLGHSIQEIQKVIDELRNGGQFNPDDYDIDVNIGSDPIWDIEIDAPNSGQLNWRDTGWDIPETGLYLLMCDATKNAVWNEHRVVGQFIATAQMLRAPLPAEVNQRANINTTGNWQTIAAKSITNQNFRFYYGRTDKNRLLWTSDRVDGDASPLQIFKFGGRLVRKEQKDA